MTSLCSVHLHSQPFDTTAPITAALDIPAGRIQVIAADRTDTTVEVLPADASKTRDVQAAKQIEVVYSDGVLRIEAPEPKNELFGPSGAVEVTVRLPAGSRVEAKVAGGGFRGVGRLGDVAFEGAQGPVRLDEVTSIRLTFQDGDIEVGRLDGDAEISTQRGSLRIGEAVRGTLTLRTESGDISVGAVRGALRLAGCRHLLRPYQQRAQEQQRRRRRRARRPRDHRPRRHHRPQPLKP